MAPCRYWKVRHLQGKPVAGGGDYFMNTKKAAELWGCSQSTVRKLCNTGMIPGIEKEGIIWNIPDEMTKMPPVTRARAVYLLQCIEEDTLPEMKNYWSMDKMVDALAYLSDKRFIIGYEGHTSLEEAAKKCKVSELGKELIRKASRGNFQEIGGEVSVEAGIDKGQPVVKVKGGISTNWKKE